MNRLFTFACIAAWYFLGAAPLVAIEDAGEVPDRARVEEKLDTFVDLEMKFTTQDGTVRSLNDLLLPDRPVIVLPVYYKCPRLCSLVMNGFVKAASDLGLKMGEDYLVLSVSMNHKEGPEVAKAKSGNYYKLLHEPKQGERGWKFLTGSEESVSKFMDSIGFHFYEDKGEFIHQAVLVMLSPKGKITRYFYGIDFPPQSLRLALVDSSQGKIGSTIEKAFLYCFRFDPSKGKYTLYVWNISRVVLTLFALFMLGAWIYLRRSEPKHPEA